MSRVFEKSNDFSEMQYVWVRDFGKKQKDGRLSKR